MKINPVKPVVLIFSIFLMLGLACPAIAQTVPQPTNIDMIDVPNDDGSGLLLSFALAGDAETRVLTEILVVDPETQESTWLPGALKAQRLETVDTKGGLPQYYGWSPAAPDEWVLTVDRYFTKEPPTAEALEKNPNAPERDVPTTLSANVDYTVRLTVFQGDQSAVFPAIKATTREQWFSVVKGNNLVLALIFTLIIMSFILAARRNPNLFIRRIQGLEAVDEAIGRATEMGKPVLQINGLDPLSTLSTVAAVNILGRIARKVANYDTDLLVPCFDPVVMTVSQEVVRNAYIEAGRPDSYREDNIFFLTDQQFSYTASVCGIMMRDRPAANFFLGYFYAESLLLAETGFSTGAIQIAGTDALAQLPFFITTCDYTLIGEELYAASAYLSREPMLLGSLKGQDVGKAFVMIVILAGTVLATFGIEWLEHVLTALN